MTSSLIWGTSTPTIWSAMHSDARSCEQSGSGVATPERSRFAPLRCSMCLTVSTIFLFMCGTGTSTRWSSMQSEKRLRPTQLWSRKSVASMMQITTAFANETDAIHGAVRREEIRKSDIHTTLWRLLCWFLASRKELRVKHTQTANSNFLVFKPTCVSDGKPPSPPA